MIAGVLLAGVLGAGAVGPWLVEDVNAPFQVIDPASVAGVAHLTPGSLTRSRLDSALAAFRAGGSYQDLEAALYAATVHHAERVRLLELGRSSEGLAIYALEVGDHDRRLRGTRPSLLVCADVEADPRSASTDTLDALVALLTETERDDALVSRATWYVVPAPLPDRLSGTDRAEKSAASTLALIDFPVGWDPWGPGRPGAYPLSLPETRAFAAFVDAVPELAAVLFVGGAMPSVERYDGTGAGAAPLEVQMHFAAPRASGTPLVPGGWREYLFGHAGLFVMEWPTSRDEHGPEAHDVHVAALSASARYLPELELVEPSVERLGGELFTVEIDLHNRGGLPTAFDPDRGSITFDVEGPRVLAVCAARVGSDEPEYRRITGGPQRYELPPIDAAARLRLRLVVESREVERLVLRAVTPRAGEVRFELDLR